MKRVLYEADKESFYPIFTYKGEPAELKVVKARPPVTSFAEAVMWNTMCLGKVKVYCLLINRVVVHKSFVVRGRFKFRYLGKHDIEIGPCWTDEKYRGRGYYPYVLSEIVSRELNALGKAYMTVAEDNTSSIRGISKAGFKKTDFVVRRSRFLVHRAVIDSNS